MSEALYSDCETYRYALTREWDAAAPRLLYIMLNPSTATEAQNDPTVERCERRANALGYGAFRVVNLFAFRATAPADLRRASAPIGPENDRVIDDSLTGWSPSLILCAWGLHGSHLGRSEFWRAKLRAGGLQIAHLGLTKAREPRHPLYVSYEIQPQLWV